mmetsp:Transcript_98682/g.205716  ORF Transcript_98682/g.205716 Transcript_98682/m.205716 type:complete len:440 (+) Transcript_98682:100-1419(+)|eukprot:CAMPEP_0206431696 /NCGR_PEP_ID=MMETSP0324_2-20121206/7506_1 /ASSEMBLY_ACC=CAM_ASM_000836 /TAXON_ID=2866 /ORGANISM="Crypthecodinium cohnii, Strain Seligo" /LENGTH=439 /DNA_ID=CAMNT_0053897649 /DNA_START=78 /DNA_END=1397 /DNA_ORIENTATION=-
MVRVKLVLELSYLGTEYGGWQTQLPQATTKLNEDRGPCKSFNRGRCSKGAGCRSAHVCSLCWRIRGVRAEHAASDGGCPPAVDEQGKSSVQDAVDMALKRAYGASDSLQRMLLAPPSGLVPSGRTDRGVHALQLVAACNCQLRNNLNASECELGEVATELRWSLNSQLAQDIRCNKISWTEDLSFNARGNSIKTYCYYIAEPAEFPTVSSVDMVGALGPIAQCVWVLEGNDSADCPALSERNASSSSSSANSPLNIDVMKEAAAKLVGEHDFFGFSSLPASTKTAPQVGATAGSTVRPIHSIEVVNPLNHFPVPLLGHCLYRGRCFPSALCSGCHGRGIEHPPGDSSVQTASAAEDTRPAVRLTSVRVTGCGFLKHQVRRIVGHLVQVGYGRTSNADTDQLLNFSHTQLQDAVGLRRPPKAPAKGLWLEKVEVKDSLEG